MQDFQAFTIKYSGPTNVLFSDVGVSEAFNPNISKGNSPQIIQLKAIWDTGASCSLITKDYANKIGLIPSGKITINGVNHTTEENTYFVNVYLPNSVCIGFVKIAEAPDLSGGAGMLIGMDIIGMGDFSVYSEKEKTVMTYRFPSIGGTDFVELAGNIKSHKVVMQKLEEVKSQRKQLTNKEKEKRRLKKKISRRDRYRNKKKRR